ncbi:MAG TPA: alanine racemase, partial [Trebonia sp.]
MTMLLTRRQARGTGDGDGREVRPARSALDALDALPAAAAAPAADRSGAQLSIDPAAVGANTRLFAAQTGGAIMAVVQADGFGHGAELVAAAALANGASWLGVTG